MQAVDGAAGALDTIGSPGSIAAAFTSATPDGQVPFWQVVYGSGAVEKPANQPTHQSTAPSAQADAEPLVVVVPRAAGNAAPPSSHAVQDAWGFDPFGDDDIAVRGVLVHECFREVRSADAIATEAQRAALLERARRRAAVEKCRPIDGERGRRMLEDVAGLLARCAAGPVAAALRPAASTLVFTELPFVRESPEGLVHGRIDRLELLVDAAEASPVAAVIVDYKTGATGVSAGQLAEKRRVYLEQLEGYAAAVGEMYRLPRSQIRLRLVFVDRGEVLE